MSKTEQTIYTILGLLDESGGRKIARCKAEVECFYESEKIAADLFEYCLKKLANEHNLQTVITRKKKDTGHIYFYSEQMNDLICSFYIKNGLTDLKSDEVPNYVDEKGYLHYANGKIGMNIFHPMKHTWGLDTEECLPRLAFLKGVYIRYGNKNKFSFGNAYHKARLVEELLVQLESPWTRFTRNMKGVPYLHKIEFEMTEEMDGLL